MLAELLNERVGLLATVDSSRRGKSQNTSRLFISNHNYAALNQQSPGSFLTVLLDLTSKDRAQVPVAFQKEPCHPSCRKPKGWSLP
jgi:hypothetical protein